MEPDFFEGHIFTSKIYRTKTGTLACGFRRPQYDRLIHAAQMQILLGEGNLNFCFPESAVNFL
jgi:hypothetical protein